MESEEAFKQVLDKLEDFIETATRRAIRVEVVENRNRDLDIIINKKNQEIAQLTMQLESEQRKHASLQDQLVIMQNKVQRLLEQIDPTEEDEVDKPEVLEALNGH